MVLKVNISRVFPERIETEEGGFTIKFLFPKASDVEEIMTGGIPDILRKVIKGVEGLELYDEGKPVPEADIIEMLATDNQLSAPVWDAYIEGMKKKNNRKTFGGLRVTSLVSTDQPAN
jgi:hypothetical protein